MKTLFPIILLASLTACSTTKVKPVALGPSTGPAQKNITLTATKSGEYVALKTHGTLTLAIQSNSSAGYRWKLASPLDPAVLKLDTTAKAKALPPIALPPENAEVTTPAVENWVFKSVGPGTAKVRMVYSRPDEPVNDSAVYTFTVNVE